MRQTCVHLACARPHAAATRPARPLLLTPCFLDGCRPLRPQLLAFALGRGPLVLDWLSPLQFCGVFLGPVVPIEVRPWRRGVRACVPPRRPCAATVAAGDFVCLARAARRQSGDPSGLSIGLGGGC